MNKTLVVMAAGMGSRFGGLKQLEPIGDNGEVLLDYSVIDAKKAGFNKVVFVIKKAIEDDFKRLVGNRIEKYIDVDYVFQELDKLPEGFTPPADRQKPYGTGHAVLCCKDKVHEPFAVINADDYYGAGAYKKVFDALENGDNYYMVGYRLYNTLTENGTVSRGVCSINDNGCLNGVKEHTKIYGDCTFEEDGQKGELSPDTVVSMNLWGFTPDIFDYLEKGFIEFLNENNDNIKSEFFLPFLVDDLIKSGKKQVGVLVAEDKWYGMTYKEDKSVLQKALKEMQNKGLYDFESFMK
ncbi:MAG: NTP transferase domain-containing protein [Oscillospiraceae bacterium]|nr:NTP transferase domain-containing protein [Candidatus Equicaccousia limihippi]